MVELGRLRALCAVATYGTVTGAAAALHCTPSAISQHLGKLERETDARLVERDGRRLRLTEAGRIFVEHATRVLAAMEEAEAALAAHHQTVSGRIMVSSFPTACRGLLPVALRRLASDHPDLRPALLESDRDTSIDMLLRGTADVALLDEWPEVPAIFPAGLVHAELGFDLADLVVRADHPLAAGADPIRLAEVSGERWIASVPGSVCHEWLVRVLPGVTPDFMVAEFETQVTLVAAGLGVAFIPRLARTVLPDGVVARSVTPPAARRVIVAWRRASAVRPAIGATVDALRAAWRARASAPGGPLPVGRA
jgi:DNA-binding transcriptional LysR family regulator